MAIFSKSGMKLENNAMLSYDALNEFAEMKREAAPKCLPFSAQQVADTFVQQYYHILRASPENLHKFYKDCSIMARPGSDGMMVFATTMQVSSSQNF